MCVVAPCNFFLRTLRQDIRMTLFVTILIIFVLTIGGVISNHVITARNLDMIRRLRSEQQKLILGREEAAERVSDLRRREKMLRIQLNDIEKGLPPIDLGFMTQEAVQTGQEGAADYSDMLEKPAKIARGENAVLESLVRGRRITPAQLQKARDYKTQTGSEYGLEDVLVMLGYLRKEDLEVARRRFGA